MTTAPGPMLTMETTGQWSCYGTVGGAVTTGNEDGGKHVARRCGTERFFRTGYEHHLAAEWIPALDGVAEKLERGGRVADLGCGHGVSSMVIAQAFRTRR